MDRLAGLTGRKYRLFDYVGAPDAERVLVLMGSGAETADATMRHLVDDGQKVGVVKVRLYRPFSVEHFLGALPRTAKVIAALDRSKEPGSAGEPLYQDVVTAVSEGLQGRSSPFETRPRVIGGRYGLSSKEFTPAMVKGILDEMKKDPPRSHFTVGIHDDVTHTSVEVDPGFDIEGDEVTRAVFWGLGSDGTVGANKNTIKIIGEETPHYAQGYFVYDSRKAGARTISHLRFGPRPIHSTYLIRKAGFVGVHQFGFLERYNTLEMAEEGATFLLNSPFGPEEIWDRIPRPVQEQIIEKELEFWVIDAYKVAEETGLGVRINTIMQTAFFALSNVLPVEEAITKIKESIRKTYGNRGEPVVRMNFAAVDSALQHLHRVEVPGAATSGIEVAAPVPEEAPDFVREVTSRIIAGEGDLLPVSALPADGTFPSGTTRWEKRNIAQEVPVWEPDICIQCGKCVIVCPHSVIRAKVYDEGALDGAPDSFKHTGARWRELADKQYTLQVAVEDCTGCTLCVEVCPAKDKSQVGRKAINMAPQLPLREQEGENWDFFLGLPEVSPADAESPLAFAKVKDVQLMEPLFEFSSACAGCGETPYLHLLSQLFGERAYIANATGCSSIYGGNLPTTPWAVNREGRGPAWNNSLFEDNAEFGLGMRLAVDKQAAFARELLGRLQSVAGDDLARAILEADQSDDAGIEAQRARVAELEKKLEGRDDPDSRDLAALADSLVEKSVWIVGGDGWAYDIGYGGLDHVLATHRNVNLLVLDTEVYSNTGGQASKATPLGAVAKFAAGGKPTPRKDLGMLAMSYGNVYVAQVAVGANDLQTLKAFREAESYDGPSLIIAYSQCIAHGIDMAKGMHQQELATASGYWPLYRFDPRRKAEGKNPLQLDSKPPKIPLKDYVYNENRYSSLARSNPEVAEKLLARAQEEVEERWRRYERMAGADGKSGGGKPSGGKSD
jgi:pyruvate-ferredoxin/flavodoxin oxidoreductase